MDCVARSLRVKMKSSSRSRSVITSTTNRKGSHHRCSDPRDTRDMSPRRVGMWSRVSERRSRARGRRWITRGHTDQKGESDKPDRSTDPHRALRRIMRGSRPISKQEKCQRIGKGGRRKGSRKSQGDGPSHGEKSKRMRVCAPNEGVWVGFGDMAKCVACTHAMVSLAMPIRSGI